METHLIEKALALCGKTMEDMDNEYMINDFSIEKFCYYLLSPEFIEKLIEKLNLSYPEERTSFLARDIGDAIYEYQSGREQPLIDLLYKI